MPEVTTVPGSPSLAGMTGLVLLLTSRCNLRCGYCYQNEKRPGRMSWETARHAIDTLLRSPESELELDLWGGEPLLETPLMRRIVEYVEANLPAGRKVELSTSTNGVLLDDETVRFFSEHRIATQLSFDGVPAAQVHRGPSTFAPVDRILRDWRNRHPKSFRDLLSIAITVHPGNIVALPDSIRYFLDLGVSAVSLAPILTHASGWEPGSVGDLDRCFGEILETSLEHYRRTGEIPLTMFRGARAARSRSGKRDLRKVAAASSSGALCAAPYVVKPVVDPEGNAHACVTFVDSYQRWTTRFLRESLEPLRLGSFADPWLDRKLAEFPAAVRRTGLFHGRNRKYSSFGRCAECAVRERCSVCPVSIAHIPGNSDPHRIPDFACAFQRVAGRHAIRFEELIGPVDILLGSGMRERKRAFLERLRPPRAGREAPG